MKLGHSPNSSCNGFTILIGSHFSLFDCLLGPSGADPGATTSIPGWFGIPYLRVMGLALCMCWLWQQCCDEARTWSVLPVAIDKMSKAFFQASIVCRVGNGVDTLFWLDRVKFFFYLNMKRAR
jgi:hypothetical protein